MPEVTERLGDEWDDERLHTLGEALRELGADVSDQWSGHAGSQHVGHWELTIAGNRIVIETETYRGLTIRGDADLVSRVAEAFERTLRR